MTLCSAEVYRARDHSMRLLYSLSTEPHGNSPFIKDWRTREDSSLWPLHKAEAMSSFLQAKLHTKELSDATQLCLALVGV